MIGRYLVSYCPLQAISLNNRLQASKENMLQLCTYLCIRVKQGCNLFSTSFNNAYDCTLQWALYVAKETSYLQDLIYDYTMDIIT